VLSSLLKAPHLELDQILEGISRLLIARQAVKCIPRSVRIPAAFCGLYGLRPSYGRVPYSLCTNSLEGQDSVLSVLGPISHSIDGIKSFMQAVISQRPWTKDPLAIRKAWDEEAYGLSEHGGGKQLCFGILWDDGLVVPHPPIIRGKHLWFRNTNSDGNWIF
jgi:Asp-tRNA(Asn)/Glu-tRNA(Gln) amidotransferase A subunit family amidase